MKIQSARVLLSQRQFSRPLRTGTETYEYLNNIIIEIGSEEHVGLGYSFCFSKDQAWAVAKLASDLARGILNEDVRSRRNTLARLRTHGNFIGTYGPTMLALAMADTALWDLLCREAGLPLFEYIGGGGRRTEVYCTTGFLDDEPSDIIEEINEIRKMGIRKFKVKIGQRDWKSDIRRLKEIKSDLYSDDELMVDANQAWNLKTALRVSEVLSDLDVNWFEEPIASSNIQGYEQLAKSSPVRIVAGESLFGFAQHYEVVRRRACDVLMINLMRCGGVSEFLDIVKVANEEEIPCSAHAFTEVSSHLMTASDNSVASEYLPGWWDNMYVEPVAIRNGEVEFTRLAGTGLELSREVAANAEIVFRDRT